MKKLAIYPGTFDPITFGHIDVIKKGINLFDKLIVAVSEEGNKNHLFNTDERIDLVKKSLLKDQKISAKRVQIIKFSSLTTALCKKYKSNVILRGLRAGFDFEQEFEMALMWRNLSPDIDVICMMSSLEHQFIYSSRIKEVARLGATIDNLVPTHIANAIKERL